MPRKVKNEIRTHTLDPYELLEALQFHTSSAEDERDCFTTEMHMEIDDYAKVYGPYHAGLQEYNAACNLCRDEAGLIVDNPITKHLESKHEPIDKAFMQADEALNDAISAQVIDCIAEALALVGVSDALTVAEVCRCVIRGGQMWDGKGFAREAQSTH